MALKYQENIFKLLKLKDVNPVWISYLHNGLYGNGVKKSMLYRVKRDILQQKKVFLIRRLREIVSDLTMENSIPSWGTTFPNFVPLFRMF